jgi:hypothetical protein
MKWASPIMEEPTEEGKKKNRLETGLELFTVFYLLVPTKFFQLDSYAF